MEYIKKVFNKYFKNLNFYEILFYLGIFLLPSAFIFGSFFILVASIIGIKLQKLSYFSSLWNKLFFLCGCLMTFSTLMQFFILTNNFNDIWQPNLTILGLANWLPFFWLFWALQPYLKGSKKRKIIALVLISGSIPILITGFVQYFLEWTGPFETLYGLIKWYQRPIEGSAGLTGLFSNQNYAGSWLVFLWPFSIALIFDKQKNNFHKIICFIILFSICLSIFLTNSRNAWGGLLFSIPMVIGIESLKWFIILLFLLGFILFICLSKIFAGDLQDLLISLIPENILMEFSDEGFEGLDVTRLEILISAIQISLFRPLFGVGAAAFTAIYMQNTGFWKGHSHNLLIELALSFGYPVSILLFITISSIIFFSYKKIFTKKIKPNKEDYFDRAWWTATFYFLVSQIVDIQYFDGRISVLFWIMLAGLNNIILEDNNKDISRN